MKENEKLQLEEKIGFSLRIKLSSREKDVAQAIMEHSNIKTVARFLGLSPNTVTRYAASLRNKLSVSNTVAAAYKAKNMGLLD